MKEATGELNMTVVTVVAIAAVAAFFYAFVWHSIKGSITASTRCSMAVNCNEDYSECEYTDASGAVSKEKINCKAYFESADKSANKK